MGDKETDQEITDLLEECKTEKAKNYNCGNENTFVYVLTYITRKERQTSGSLFETGKVKNIVERNMGYLYKHYDNIIKTSPSKPSNFYKATPTQRSQTLKQKVTKCKI